MWESSYPIVLTFSRCLYGVSRILNTTKRPRSKLDILWELKCFQRFLERKELFSALIVLQLWIDIYIKKFFHKYVISKKYMQRYKKSNVISRSSSVNCVCIPIDFLVLFLRRSNCLDVNASFKFCLLQFLEFTRAMFNWCLECLCVRMDFSFKVEIRVCNIFLSKDSIVFVLKPLFLENH